MVSVRRWVARKEERGRKRGATNLTTGELVHFKAAHIRRMRRLRLRVKVNHRIAIGARRLDVAVEEENPA